MKLTPAAAIAALFMLVGAVPAQAQYGGTGWYAYECPQRDGEGDYGWVQRCDELFSAKAQAERREAERLRAEYAAMKGRLLKQAALPAARNGLIGKWRQAPRAQGAAPRTDALGQIVNQVLDGCALLFGEGGSVEFRVDRYLVTDSYGTDDLGAVAYREGRDNTVFVLPQIGVELMAMQLETTDRFRVINSPTPCVMMRVGTGSASDSRAAAPIAPPRPAAPAAPRAPVALASAAPPTASGSLLTFNDNGVGYQCPNGQMPIVISCEEASATVPALCKVLNAEKPVSRGGFQMTDIEPKSTMLSRVKGCGTRKVAADAQGNLNFVQ